MNKVLKRIGAAVVDIVIVLLVLLSIIISISSITAKANDGVPDLFGYSPFTVQTNSMKPTMNKGDYILTEKCDTDDLKVGDIITYHTVIEGQRVINTHRIDEVIKSGSICQFRTKGDNNPTVDETLVSSGDVISKYTGTRVPMMGTVINYLSTQMGFFLVILLPVLFFTLYQIFKLIKVIMHNHKVDTINAMEEASDEAKEAIIAEYLAKQKAEQEQANEEDKEETKSEEETEDNND